ncbi:MAG TPA: BON domain-containing protein [Vicinamibacterales bacterium]|nr:BON domain-containing protein [Vicinamibacterales bacterium]
MAAGCSQTDPGITTAVKSKFAADDTVKANRIDVDTKDKVVTLKGEVQSAAARARAVELAKSTEGVRDVVDSMTVVPEAAATSGRTAEAAREASRDAREAGRETGAVMGDAGITAAVKSKMLADTTVSGLKIDVDTKDGIVTLTGDVKSAAEKRRAVEIAKETDNVKSVKDQLKIVK